VNTHASVATQGGKVFQAVDVANDAVQRRQVGKGVGFEAFVAGSVGSVCNRGVIALVYKMSLQNSLVMSTKTSNWLLHYEVSDVKNVQCIQIFENNVVEKSEYVHINEVNVVEKSEWIHSIEVNPVKNEARHENFEVSVA
jgi:hypothetical protein